MCAGTSTLELRNSAWTVLGTRNFDAADRISNMLANCDDKDYFPYNIKGSIAFYRMKYDDAVKYFEGALALAPANMPDIANNLADSLVELALQSKPEARIAQFNRAIQLYGSKSTVAPNSTFAEYKMARVLLFSGEAKKALSHIISVPIDYEYDGGRGKARILEGAIYLAMSKNASQDKSKYLEKAKENFLVGVKTDRAFWTSIFRGERFNVPEPFDQIVEIYGDYAVTWSAADKQ